jgi:hypothetical protein
MVRREAENNFRAYVDVEAEIEESEQAMRLERDLGGMLGSLRIVEVQFGCGGVGRKRSEE